LGYGEGLGDACRYASSLSDGDCHGIGEGSTVSSWPQPAAESTWPHTRHLNSPHVDVMCQLHHQRPDEQRQSRLCVRDLCLIQTPPPLVDKTMTAWRPVQRAPRACPATLARMVVRHQHIILSLSTRNSDTCFFALLYQDVGC
jgi:hypothetical protein